MQNDKTLYVTPKGVLVYPHLNTPDTYKNQSNYKTFIRVTEKEGQELLKKFQPMLDAWQAECGAEEQAPLPIMEEKDKDGVPTGNFLIKVKMKSHYQNKHKQIVEMRPKLVDGKLSRIPPTVPIGGGSVARANFTIYQYCRKEQVRIDGKYEDISVAGFSFRLSGVQIIKLVEPSSGSGFDEDPEGYIQEFAEEGGADY